MEPEPKRSIRSRIAARNLCFQVLYALDTPEIEADDTVASLTETLQLSEPLQAYFDRVIAEFRDNLDCYDDMIRALLASGWDLNRIAKTDRAALRLAAIELWCFPNLPPKVTINEAVNLAKAYGTPESGKFVNGLLANLLKQSPKAEWIPTKFESLEAAGEDEAETEIEAEEIATVEEEIMVEEGSADYEEMMSAGKWIVKTEAPQ